MLSARSGDWNTFEKLLLSVQSAPLPSAQDERTEYLKRLKEVVVVAKASRSGMAASLHRLSAAARFQDF